jgi:CubicO group peptidase (beta-lactamase class C family)
MKTIYSILAFIKLVTIPYFSYFFIKSTAKRFFKFLFTLLIINNLNAQNIKKIQIDSLMKGVYELGIFNGNVLVVEKGKTIYQASFGYTNGSKKSRLTADYRFNIGSIGKEFNAVSIMMLKEEGKLNLDDKLSKFMPDLPTWADKISIKNLLQYTSGLPDLNWKTIKNDGDILADMKMVEKLHFEPGTNYEYNNSNTFFQRRIIEKASGMSFQKFVEKRMLQPCKMTKSVIDPDLKGKNIAVSFNNNSVEDIRQFGMPFTGWVSVTDVDLYQWSQCLHQYKLINKASVNEILTPFLPFKQVGLGAGIIEGERWTEHSHHGSSFDFEALMYTQPSEDISIILLTNNKNFKVFEIKDAIKSILNGKPYKKPKKSILKAMDDKIKEMNIVQLIAFYDNLKAKYPSDYNFDDDSELNSVGYSLMGNKRIDDAIEIFKLNVKLFPQTGNMYDSLGEAYLSKGDKINALINYKKTYELDPKNMGAKEIIEQLEK